MYCYISNVKFSEMMNKMKYFLAVTSDLIEQKGHNGPILLTWHSSNLQVADNFIVQWRKAKMAIFIAGHMTFIPCMFHQNQTFFWWWQPCEVKSKLNKTFWGDIVKRFFFIFSQRPSCLANWNKLSYFA